MSKASRSRESLSLSPPFETRLIFDFYPRRFIENNHPKFINPAEAGMKGLVQHLKHLPRSNVWYAKGIIAPTETHPQLPLLSDDRAIFSELPEPASHTAVGIFATGSMATGEVETSIMADKVNRRQGATDDDVRRTLNLVNALGRRLAIATQEVMSRVVAGDLDLTEPTRRMVSTEPSFNSASSYSVIAQYSSHNPRPT